MRLLFLAAGIVFGTSTFVFCDQVDVVEADRIAELRLSRFSWKNVENIKSNFKRRMRNIRLFVGGCTLASASAIWLGWNSSKLSPEQEAIRADIKAKRQTMNGLNPNTEAAKINALDTQIKNRLRELSGDYEKDAPPSYGVFGTAFRQFLAMGAAGIAVVSGHQLLKYVFGTLDEGIRLCLHGYEYWYAHCQAQLQKISTSLLDSFELARRNVQQTVTEQQLLASRQQRRVSSLRDSSLRSRGDIINDHQQLKHTFEELAALLLIIAPHNQHALIKEEVEAVAARFAEAANLLESDLKGSSYGMIVHYRNQTIASYSFLKEDLDLFLSASRRYVLN